MEEQAREGPERRELPPGLYWRGGSLWIRYMVNGAREQREPVPPGTDGKPRSLRAAVLFRNERITAQSRGEVAPDSRRVRVGDALDAVLADYRANGRDTLKDAMQRAAILRAAIGELRATDLSTTLVQRLQAEWLAAGRAPATINRVCNTLRRGFRLLARESPPRLHHVPYIPRLEERSARGRRFTRGEADKILAACPDYLRDVFSLALLLGTRRGQLSRTLRRYVDLDAEIITYPACETKAEEEHAIPLDPEPFAVVERNMARAVPHCPFLLHGPDCKPGHTPSKRWGCLGDFKNAWATACEAAGVGHRRFHDTRVTFATDAMAGGMTERDAMAVGGWKTRSVFDRYNLGDVEALRKRLAASRQRGKVVALRSAGGKV